MMIAKSKGIILRTVKYSETSLILDIFTRELGLKTYIISGVRKKNAKVTLGMLQPMNILDLVIYNKENTKINRIKEAQMAYVFKNLLFDIKKSSIALFIIEIINKSIKEKETNKEFYDFCENSLVFLDQTSKNISNFHLIFLIKMSQFLGFNPISNHSSSNIYFDLREGKFTHNIPHHNDFLNEKDSKNLILVLSVDLEFPEKIAFSRVDKQNLLKSLILYYKIHLIDFGRIKTLEVFKRVFDSK